MDQQCRPQKKKTYLSRVPFSSLGIVRTPPKRCEKIQFRGLKGATAPKPTIVMSDLKNNVGKTGFLRLHIF